MLYGLVTSLGLAPFLMGCGINKDCCLVTNKAPVSHILLKLLSLLQAGAQPKKDANMPLAIMMASYFVR